MLYFNRLYCHIFLFRYMICNKVETRQRREQVKKLKDELSVLLSKLDK